MIKTPDIEDIDDVSRFAVGAWYPVKRNKLGDVTLVARIENKAEGMVLCRTSDGISPTYGISSVPFSEFLTWDQGYYKSRLVEYNGSIIYLANSGADENRRNHSYRIDSIQVRHVHQSVTGDFELKDKGTQALVGLSTRRTPAYEAITKLEEGSVIGCALSDNFGLATFENSAEIQLMRRTKPIGYIRDGRPVLNHGADHYFYAVSKLWR